MTDPQDTGRTVASPAELDEWLRLFASRDEVAEEYARLIFQTDAAWSGWAEVNAAILRRWSPSGLRYIKTKAWRAATIEGYV